MRADAKKARAQRQKVERVYVLSPPARALPSGWEFLNKDEACRGSGSSILEPPTRFQRGFRSYPVKLRLRVSKRLGRKPADIEFYSYYWLVSDRAKQLLDSISQTDFAYLPVDTEVDAGSEPATYWLCDAVTVLDAIDEARSTTTSGIADDGSKYHRISGQCSLVFDENMIREHNVFRMKTATSTLICSERFKVAFKEAGLTGLSFREAFLPPFDKIGTVTALFDRTARVTANTPVGKIKLQGRGEEIWFWPEVLDNPNQPPKIGQAVRVQGRHVKHYGFYLATHTAEI
jgi:hypothetical protein